MLDARRLRVLQAVASSGTLAAAAEALGYTPSAVSQQIATLERETGMKLFDRSSRGVELTAAGRLVLERATPILRQLDEAEASIRAMRDGASTALSIASFASAAARLVPQALAGFQRAEPDVEVTLLVADNDEAISAVRSAAADIALVVDYDVVQISNTAGLRVERLVDDPVVVALPEGHRLTSMDAIVVQDLAGDPWIRCATPACAKFTARVLELTGINPPIPLQTDDYPATLGLVANGLGVALVPTMAMRDLPAGVTSRPLSGPKLTRIISALTLQHRMGTHTDAMIRHLQSAAAPLNESAPSR